jgi:hypothetical protein
VPSSAVHPGVVPSSGSRLAVLVAGLVASAACLALHSEAMRFPVLMLDDFGLLLESWTWPATWDNLWLPHNEHAMPLGRLSTWALVQLGGGKLTAMPALTALQGPLAVVLGMWLVYLLVRRETELPLHGLLAMTLFGVSAHYNQAVSWFSASFVVLALDTILLALLAAQRWRRTGRLPYLLAVVVLVALAPAWFASGILAGPLCCLYLLSGRLRQGRQTVASLGVALVPLLGTLLFLGVLLIQPDTARGIVHSGHYQGKTVFEVFHPLAGLEYTLRALVDHLLIGTLGIWKGPLPDELVLVGLALLLPLAAWWWWRATHRRLLLLGLGFILFNNLLIYSFRTPWGYAQMTYWNRYDLLPHAGLTLYGVGGLPAWQGRRLGLRKGRLFWLYPLAIGLLSAILLVSQVWRIPARDDSHCAEQRAALRRVEEMDARCRQHRIGAHTAHEVLGRLDLPSDDGQGNGWKFLRGSDDPLPITVEEARRLLGQ